MPPVPFQPMVECLEDRCVPAGTANPFAHFTSETVADPAAITIVLHKNDFTFARSRVGLSLVLRSDDGAADPTAISLESIKGVAPKILAQRDDFAGATAGLTVAQVGKGTYRAVLPASLSGRRWTLDVCLLGDVNGDYRVNKADLSIVQSAVGKQSGEFGVPRQADLDGDGVIGDADLAIVKRLRGSKTRVRPIVLVAGLAPGLDRDGNRIVLDPQIAITGQTVQRTTVRLDIGADGAFDKKAKFDAQHRFRFRFAIPPGTTPWLAQATDRFGQRVVVAQEVSLGDVILDWNAVHLTAIRDYTVFSQVPYSNRIVFTAPPLAARNLAMMHIAMADAIHAVTKAQPAIQVDLTAPPGTSPVAAAAAAAHDVLVALYPKAEQIALFDAALAEALASVADGSGKSAGIALGREAAAAILAWRTTDGAAAAATHVPGWEPGDWQRTAPDFLPPLVPQFQEVVPFALDDGTALRPAAPPELTSAEYAAALNQVKELGRFDSATRTADQTEIAIFWADGGGTFTPAGHWNQIAAEVALQMGGSLADHARLFAALNIALADAGIACWDAKYFFDFWRPITAIHQADQDGNELTAVDAAWTPLLKTPNFPTYTSGHSTFSGAAATVLTAFFGDDVAFTSRADGHEGFTSRPLAKVITRSFTSFEQAAHEASVSRIYGGIHFEFDCTIGIDVGNSIGQLVVARFLEPGGSVG